MTRPSPDSAQSPKPEGDRLPFEPRNLRKTKAKATGQGPEPAASQANQEATEANRPAPGQPASRLVKPVPPPKRSAPAQAASPAPRRYTREEMAIPEVVSQRMLRRTIVFCGIPTGLGFLSFIGGYFVNQSGWLELPNVVVLATSLGGLVVGILGLSYGILSASWDEDEAGTWLGFSEFRTNLGRTIEANRTAREARLQAQGKKTD